MGNLVETAAPTTSTIVFSDEALDPRVLLTLLKPCDNCRSLRPRPFCFLHLLSGSAPNDGTRLYELLTEGQKAALCATFELHCLLAPNIFFHDETELRPPNLLYHEYHDHLNVYMRLRNDLQT